jgi:hypothetical protein
VVSARHGQPVRAGIAQLVERQPSKLRVAGSNPVSRSNPWGWGHLAHVAQAAEHFLGKEEVTGSIPVVSSGSSLKGVVGLSAVCVGSRL